MTKGIILRVLDGTKLPSELNDSLNNLLPDYQLEYYKEKPDYQDSYKRRVDSLYKAFLFILKAYPPNAQSTLLSIDTLKDYADECKQSCDLSKELVIELQKELEHYTAKLVDVLSIAWEWPKKYAVEEAIECLNEAEQYVLMSEGRPDLATLIPIKTEDSISYILQLDKSIPPYYEQWIDELTLLKKQKFPKTPLWFHHLPEYQKAYFYNLDKKITEHQDIKEDINSFNETFEKIKEKSLNLNTELNQISKNALPLASWFNELTPHHKEMVRVLSADPNSFEKNLGTFKQDLFELSFDSELKKTITDITTIPQWYWVLSDKQQCFLSYVLENASSIEEAVSFLSSRHRTLPAPANFAVHSLFKIDNQGNIIAIGKERYRSSHIASRDGLKWPELVQKRHSESNFTKVTELVKSEQPILFQTLISPILALNTVPIDNILSNFVKIPPDLKLYQIARNTVSQSLRAKDTLQNNHPLNMAKFYYFTEEKDRDSLTLIQEAKKYNFKCTGLQELIDAYKGALESSIGTATIWDYNGRELFLSSLEQLIIFNMDGYSYGSCVSGKDRKAIELIHTDAMLLYKELYNCWPQFDEPEESENRINFVQIVVTLYVSRHQHEHAGQNAPGSEGIKTPSAYFPTDIVNAINKHLGNEKALKFDDRLATNNEVCNISKKLTEYLLPENKLLCKLTAKYFGEKNCTKLYDALMLLINEKKKFFTNNSDLFNKAMNFFLESNEKRKTPEGIKNIQEVMDDERSGKNNVERLEAIFYAVINRPEKNSSRTEATNSIYNRIRDLLKPCKNELLLQELIDEVVQEWEKLFDESKNEKTVCYYL